MATVTKDLGIATAYGYAKSKGYTGTEDEFAQAMLDITTAVDDAQQYAQDAEDAKDDAQASAQSIEQSAAQIATNTSDIADLKADLSEFTGNETIQLVANKCVTLNGSTVEMADGIPQYATGSTTYACGMLRCTGGDVFTINGQGGSAPRLWGFVDASGNVLAVAGASASDTDLIITAPQNTSWIIVHTNDGRQSFKGILIKDRVTQNTQSIEDVKNTVDLVIEDVEPENKLNPSTFTEGKTLSSTGVLQNSTTAKTSDYIPTNGASTVSYARIASNSAFYDNGYEAMFQYDANKQPVGTRIMNVANPIPLREDCAYIRVACVNANVFNEIAFDVSGLTRNTISDFFEPYKVPATSLYTYTINGNDISIESEKEKYVITHEINASIRQDTWRVKSGYIKQGTAIFPMWEGSDADGVVQIAGESDFIGGYHGDEITTDVKLYIDGKQTDLASSDTGKFSDLRMYVTSNVFHCIENDPSDTVVFERNKIIAFSKNGLEISNHWTAKVTVNISTAYMGMFSCARNLINGYTTNADYLLRDSTAGAPWSDLLKKTIFELNKGATAEYEIMDGSDQKYYGRVQNYAGSGVSDRLKVYFAQIGASTANPYTVNQGSAIYAKSKLCIR